AMLVTNFLLLVATCTISAYAGPGDDYSGRGTIAVLKSRSDPFTTTPADSVGCLDVHGKFVADGDSSHEACAIFTRLEPYPYTLSTEAGNCTWTDTSQETNTDSIYGGNDYAWSCWDGVADIYDSMGTINGSPYLFLCKLQACVFDAKRIPKADEALPVWPFRYGSQQMGITPGHVELQLLWQPVGSSS
ncbi:hypothetical protein BDW02DRAFT_510851, partial [Decorospora gaudefroyi]